VPPGDLSSPGILSKSTFDVRQFNRWPLPSCIFVRMAPTSTFGVGAAACGGVRAEAVDGDDGAADGAALPVAGAAAAAGAVADVGPVLAG
jgi:hypothetical protein